MALLIYLLEEYCSYSTHALWQPYLNSIEAVNFVCNNPTSEYESNLFEYTGLVKYFDIGALEERYPLPPVDPNEGSLYVPVQRFKARQVLWGALVMKAFSVALVFFVVLIGIRLYRLFSPGLEPGQNEFLISSIALLIALSAFFSLAVYYLSTRAVRDVFDRWYYLTGEFVESYHRGNVQRIYWNNASKVKFWTFGNFLYGRISEGRKTIVFTINFVNAHPRPQKVRMGLTGIHLIYGDGRKVRLQDAQKAIFEAISSHLG